MQKFMQQRFEDSQGFHRKAELSTEVKLKEINKDLYKVAGDEYFRSRAASLKNQDSALFRRKVSDQKQCHYVNLSLGAGF